MTRDEMLDAIEALRKEGHKIGITGSGSHWTCEIDGKRFEAPNPTRAFLEAVKELGL